MRNGPFEFRLQPDPPSWCTRQRDGGVANSASHKSDLEHDPWASRTKHANAVLMHALVMHQVLGSPQDGNRLRVADVWAGLRHRRLESRFLQNERVGVNGCWNGVNRARPSPTLTLRPLNAIGIADQVHRPAARAPVASREVRDIVRLGAGWLNTYSGIGPHGPLKRCDELLTR